MSIEGWKYYNHAAIPTTAPHHEVNLSPIENGEIWRIKGALMARWAADWDCKEETNWWYIIKDTPIDLERCSKGTRKEIRRGLKYSDILVINPEEFEDEIKEVYRLAVLDYEHADVSAELECVEKQNDEEWIGAFCKESGKLIGYKVAVLHEDYVEMRRSKVNPEYLNKGIFAAMNYFQIVRYINSEKYRYMSNGTRSILHETNYNDYLEKKFEFRKAYCHLNIKYRFPVGMLIKVLYPFRGMLSIFSSIGIVRRINGILKMEEAARK